MVIPNRGNGHGFAEPAIIGPRQRGRVCANQLIQIRAVAVAIDIVAHEQEQLWARLNGDIQQRALAVLVEAGTDPDLVEGYSHFKKTALKNMVDTLTSAVQNLNDRIGILKSNKKPRKQKRKSPESQIKRLNFLQRSDAFAIDSVNPVDIIGAQRLIMYNTKNKKAILLIAVEPKSGLAVKGSTVIGFDSAKSFEKTIRNPDEFLKNQNDCRKTVVSAIRYLTGLKTKSSEPTGRVNSNCLILQVQ